MPTHDAEESRRRRRTTTNCMADSPTSNTPLTAAAMANWKPTMPDASLNSDSPFSTLVCRCVSAASLPSDDTATASVGPSAAPSAKAAASGIAGHTACNAKPTATIVAIAKPIANDNDSFTDLSSSDLSISCASKYSSGAMNSTMNSSGLSVTSGKERQLRCQRAQRDLHERRGDLGYEATYEGG